MQSIKKIEEHGEESDRFYNMYDGHYVTIRGRLSFFISSVISVLLFPDLQSIGTWPNHWLTLWLGIVYGWV